MSFLPSIPALPAIHVPVAIHAVEIKLKAIRAAVIKEQAAIDRELGKAAAEIKFAKLILNILKGGDPIAELEYQIFRTADSNFLKTGIGSFSSLLTNLRRSIATIQSSPNFADRIKNTPVSSQISSINYSITSFASSAESLTIISPENFFSIVPILDGMISNLDKLSSTGIYINLQNIGGFDVRALIDLYNNIQAITQAKINFQSIVSQIKAIKKSAKYNRQDLIQILNLISLPKIPRLPRLF